MVLPFLKFSIKHDRTKDHQASCLWSFSWMFFHSPCYDVFSWIVNLFLLSVKMPLLIFPYFWFVTITDNTAVNTPIQVFMCKYIFIPLEEIFRCIVAGTWIIFKFNFVRHCNSVPWCAYIILPSQQCWEITFALQQDFSEAVLLTF